MSMPARFIAWLSRGRTAVIGVPYVWLLVFFLAPFFVLAKISVSEMGTVLPSDILSVKDGVVSLSIKFANYVFLTQDALYYKTYLSSLKYAFWTTVLCLAICCASTPGRGCCRPTAGSPTC
jgi:putrescine transport system permease protein